MRIYHSGSSDNEASIPPDGTDGVTSKGDVVISRRDVVGAGVDSMVPEVTIVTPRAGIDGRATQTRGKSIDNDGREYLIRG